MVKTPTLGTADIDRRRLLITTATGIALWQHDLSFDRGTEGKESTRRQGC